MRATGPAGEEHDYRCSQRDQGQTKRASHYAGGVKALTEAGHKVLVETQAGALSGFPDEEYQNAALRLWATRVTRGQGRHGGQGEGADRAGVCLLPRRAGLFTYLHLAPLPGLTDKLLESKVIGIAYETVRDARGTLRC